MKAHYSLDSVVLPNPSNLSRRLDTYTLNCNCTTIQVPTTISIYPNKPFSPFENVTLNLTSYEGKIPIFANFTYFKKVNEKNVDIIPVETPEQISTMADHSYSFKIKNNEDVFLRIRYILINDFFYESVNSTSLRGFQDGQLDSSRPFGQQIISSVGLEPHKESVITLAFDDK